MVIYLKNSNTCVHKNICTPIFIAALFTVAKTYIISKCLLLEDWIKKICYTYTMEYYSVIRKDEILPFVTTWRDLENIMLREISQSEKAKSHMISLIYEM